MDGPDLDGPDRGGPDLDGAAADGIPVDGHLTGGAAWCSYAELGERFFDLVVTADRLTDSVAGLAGRPLEIGPVGAGPGKIARVTVTGQVGKPAARRVDGEPLRFEVALPLEIDLLVELPGQDARFHGTVTVGLALTVRAAPPLRLVFDVEPAVPDNVEVDLVADGMRAGLLRAAAGLDEEMKRYVVRYVNSELGSDRARRAREVDLLARIDRAWSARR